MQALVQQFAEARLADVQTTLAYVAVAAIVHGLAVQFLHWMPNTEVGQRRR